MVEMMPLERLVAFTGYPEWKRTIRQIQHPGCGGHFIIDDRIPTWANSSLAACAAAGEGCRAEAQQSEGGLSLQQFGGFGPASRHPANPPKFLVLFFRREYPARKHRPMGNFLQTFDNCLTIRGVQ